MLLTGRSINRAVLLGPIHSAAAWATKGEHLLPGLLHQAWLRYGVPLVVAETSHVGQGRARWLHEMAAQTAAAMASGIPVHGLCLCPIMDRPDWNDLQHWHRSGLWDAIAPGQAETAASLPTARRLAADYALALAAWQARLPA